MKIKLKEVAMSERLKCCLKRHGIEYLEEIYDFSDEDYFKVRNIGRKCIQEAKEIVSLYLSLD